jgi:CheY-like chemotaxis protein
MRIPAGPQDELLADEEALMERPMGDSDLARVVVSGFADDTPKQLCRACIASCPERSQRGRACAHSIRGAAATVGADSLQKSGVRKGNDCQKGRNGCHLGAVPRPDAGVPGGKGRYEKDGKQSSGAGKQTWIMKTVIVEDDFTSRLLLQEFLEQYGAIHIVVDGKEAVEAMRSAMDAGEPYDLVCLDIMMAVMDGQQTLKEMRGLEASRNNFALQRCDNHHDHSAWPHHECLRQTVHERAGIPSAIRLGPGLITSSNAPEGSGRTWRFEPWRLTGCAFSFAAGRTVNRTTMKSTVRLAPADRSQFQMAIPSCNFSGKSARASAK